MVVVTPPLHVICCLHRLVQGRPHTLGCPPPPHACPEEQGPPGLGHAAAAAHARLAAAAAGLSRGAHAAVDGAAAAVADGAAIGVRRCASTQAAAAIVAGAEVAGGTGAVACEVVQHHDTV